MTDPKQSSSPPKEADKITTPSQAPPKESCQTKEKKEPQKTIRFVRAPPGQSFMISFS